MKALPKLLLTLTAATALAFAHPAKANLITNPGFETGDLTGWTPSGGTGYWSVSDIPHSGRWAALLHQGFLGGAVTLSQTISTFAGSTYDLSFWLTCLDRSPNTTFQVFWNGTLIIDIFGSSSFDYTQFGASGLLATGSSTELDFVGSSDRGFNFGLDDVSVTGPAGHVPEPFSTLWLALPFAGIVALRRKVRC